MKRVVPMIFVLLLLALPVSAMEFTAPEAPGSAEIYIPETTTSFGQDLWRVLQAACSHIMPTAKEAAGTCFSIIAVVVIQSIIQNFTGGTKTINNIVGVLGIATLLLQPANTLIRLGADTVRELSEYGKMLLPVLTAAMAAQGSTATSASIYAATALFDTVLTSLIAKVIVPMIYIYLATCIANSALQEQTLKQFRVLGKWTITWSLKIILYVFTGYIAVTGVINGTVDASALKAAKLTISGTVPVIGNILADASETVLLSASVMKSTAGIYGVITIIAIFIGPFLRVGIHYLLLKFTSVICGIVGTKTTAEFVQDFSDSMGFIMGMIGAVCVMHLISAVCFMKGVA